MPSIWLAAWRARKASLRYLAAGALCVALRIAEEVENATIVFVVCDRGDRYLSTGVFPA
jgi:cysteine synthase